MIVKNVRLDVSYAFNGEILKETGLKAVFFYLSWSAIVQKSKHWVPLERHFKELSFERNFVILAQILLKLYPLKAKFCDKILVSFNHLVFFLVSLIS